MVRFIERSIVTMKGIDKNIDHPNYLAERATSPSRAYCSDGKDGASILHDLVFHSMARV
jgi:hypothetical protein